MLKYGKYLNMKYAKIEDDVVKVISYEPVNGYEEVSDDVYADMVKKENGTFDYTEQFKIDHKGIEE